MPAGRVRGQIVSGDLISITPAAVTIAAVLAVAALTFKMLKNISQFIYYFTRFEYFTQRFFPYVPDRKINTGTWLYISLCIDKTAVKVPFAGKSCDSGTCLP
jgi:hypothetical protein